MAERRCVDPAAPTTLFDSPPRVLELLRGLLPCCCTKSPRSWAADEDPFGCTDSTLLEAESTGLSLLLLPSLGAGATSPSAITFLSLVGFISWLTFATSAFASSRTTLENDFCPTCPC